MRKNTVLSVFFLGLATLTFGQKYSNEFLSIGIGARAQGMAGAVTSSVNDATAALWNPAGLAFLDIDNGVQLGAMHHELFAGVGKYDYLGIATPISDHKRALAFSFVRFGIDNIPNTLSLYQDDGTIDYRNVKSFSAADYAFFGSYAQKIGNPATSKLSVGANAKIVYRNIGTFAHSWGFGADLGLQYKPNKKWSFALMLKDITTTFNAWSFTFTEKEKQQLSLNANTIPISSVEYTLPQIIFGGSYYKSFGALGLTTAVDLVMTTDGKRNTLISTNPISVAPNIGAELDYKKIVFLRAGTNSFQQYLDLNKQKQWSSSPAIGLGVKIKRFQFDYALSKLGGGQEQAAYSHIISLLFHIKPQKTARFD